jgi:hypothetical protein
VKLNHSGVFKSIESAPIKKKEKEKDIDEDAET